MNTRLTTAIGTAAIIIGTGLATFTAAPTAEATYCHRHPEYCTPSTTEPPATTEPATTAPPTTEPPASTAPPTTEETTTTTSAPTTTAPPDTTTTLPPEETTTTTMPPLTTEPWFIVTPLYRVTPPTCTTAGTVEPIYVEGVSWIANPDGSFTAYAWDYYELTEDVTTPPPAPRLTGDACATTTAAPTTTPRPTLPTTGNGTALASIAALSILAGIGLVIVSRRRGVA